MVSGKNYPRVTTWSRDARKVVTSFSNQGARVVIRLREAEDVLEQKCLRPRLIEYPEVVIQETRLGITPQLVCTQASIRTSRTACRVGHQRVAPPRRVRDHPRQESLSCLTSTDIAFDNRHVTEVGRAASGRNRRVIVERGNADAVACALDAEVGASRPAERANGPQAQTRSARLRPRRKDGDGSCRASAARTRSRSASCVPRSGDRGRADSVVIGVDPADESTLPSSVDTSLSSSTARSGTVIRASGSRTAGRVTGTAEDQEHRPRQGPERSPRRGRLDGAPLLGLRSRSRCLRSCSLQLGTLSRPAVRRASSTYLPARTERLFERA